MLELRPEQKMGHSWCVAMVDATKPWQSCRQCFYLCQLQPYFELSRFGVNSGSHISHGSSNSNTWQKRLL